MKLNLQIKTFKSKDGIDYYVVDTYIIYDSGKQYRLSRVFIKKWLYNSLLNKNKED